MEIVFYLFTIFWDFYSKTTKKLPLINIKWSFFSYSTKKGLTILIANPYQTI